MAALHPPRILGIVWNNSCAFTVFLLPFHYFPLELTSYLLFVCVCVLSTLHPSPAAGRVQSVHLICMHACLVLNGHQNVHNSYIQGKSYVRSKSPFHLLFFFARATTPGVRTYTSSSSSTTLPQHFAGTVIDRPHPPSKTGIPASRELVLSCICRA